MGAIFTPLEWRVQNSGGPYCLETPVVKKKKNVHNICSMLHACRPPWTTGVGACRGAVALLGEHTSRERRGAFPVQEGG